MVDLKGQNLHLVEKFALTSTVCNYAIFFSVYVRSYLKVLTIVMNNADKLDYLI